MCSTVSFEACFPHGCVTTVLIALVNDSSPGLAAETEDYVHTVQQGLLLPLATLAGSSLPVQDAEPWHLRCPLLAQRLERHLLAQPRLDMSKQASVGTVPHLCALLVNIRMS